MMALRSGRASASSLTIDESASDGGRSPAGSLDSARASRPTDFGEDDGGGVASEVDELGWEGDGEGVVGGVGGEGASVR